MKNIKSLCFRNFLMMAFVLILSFALLGSSFVFITYRHTIKDKAEAMSSIAESASRMISAYDSEWGISGPEVRAILAWTSHVAGFHLVLCNDDGVVLSCSDEIRECPHIGSAIPERFLNLASTHGKYTGITTLGGLYNNERYAIGIEVTNRNGTDDIGYLFVSGQSAEMAGAWREFAFIFLIIAAISLVIAFILSYIVSNRRAKPIREMAEAAHKFGRGDFSVRVKNTEGNDELGELADSFNAMADSLERSENARRNLIANVSHELKTPMTTITGFADGILDGMIPPEKQREYIEIISSETKRLNRLVRGMLDVSYLQTKDTTNILQKSFDLSEVVRIALLSLEQKIVSKNLDVEASLPEEEVMVLGDKDGITQVVYNLIDNATKFATAGTALKLTLWKQEGKAFVSVGNRGETISREELPLIFDRFHKTDRSRSEDKDGVGLGLYIVKTILDSHNEDIFVTSQDGYTEFVFTLTMQK